MVTTTNLRILRLKYRITLNELAEAAGVSNQHLSYLERGETRASPEQQEKMAKAFAKLIEERDSSLYALSDDFIAYRDCLLTPMEVESDEF